jgi:PspAA-like protein
VTVIARILGEGQYEVADEHLDELNALDATLQDAVDSRDEQRFAGALAALLEAVRRLGTPLPDAALAPSDILLPDQDTSLSEVEDLLAGGTGEGLIPG